jgi:hypothetical protein
MWFLGSPVNKFAPRNVTVFYYEDKTGDDAHTEMPLVIARNTDVTCGTNCDFKARALR